MRIGPEPESRPKFVCACLAALIGLASAQAPGCASSIGPVHLRIETSGVRHDDFVIEPVEEYGRLHGSKMVRRNPRVVASEEDVTLPRFAVGPTFTTLLVSTYHPEFVYAWTGESNTVNGEMTLPPLRPQRWTDFLAEHGEASLYRVEDHLLQLQLSYVPVFEAGAPRQRLRRHLPGLRALVQQATWSRRNSSDPATEAEARAHAQETLQALSDLMR